jgi:two-component system, NarL family, nitrate/nitrite response regulator NarL
MTERIKVVVVDDHSLFRVGVIQSLQLDSDIEVVGDGASAKDAIELARSCRPHVALIDISMPGNGIDAARAVRQLNNAPQVIMLTVSESDDDVMQALDAGVVGYVLKGVSAPDLIAAVKGVAAGGSFVSPTLALRLLSASRSVASSSPVDTLSDRERRTLTLVGRGMNNREIAEELGVHQTTVKWHVSNIIKKIGVRNRVEAALVAQRELDV